MKTTSLTPPSALPIWARVGAVILALVWTLLSFLQVWNSIYVMPITAECSLYSGFSPAAWASLATIASIAASAVFQLAIGRRPGHAERPGVITAAIGLGLTSLGGIWVLFYIFVLLADYPVAHVSPVGDVMSKFFAFGNLVVPSIAGLVCLLVGNSTPKTTSGKLADPFSRRRQRRSFTTVAVLSSVFLIGSYFAVATECGHVVGISPH